MRNAGCRPLRPRETRATRRIFPAGDLGCVSMGGTQDRRGVRMEQLKVIGTEDDALVLATESGETFSLAVDDVLRIELRKARREREGDTPVNRPSPREIQAHIRAGLSADEVATLLGARVEDVARFEGPVLAEREHVVGQARAVPLLLAADLDG